VTGSNPQLPFDGDAAEPRAGPPLDAPCVYVATKITGTTPGSPERQMIQFAVAAIRDALIEATTQAAEEPWDVRVHAPVEWTTPDQTPNLGPTEIFGRNAHHVFGEADALIVYGWAPSAGVGQEITWAVQLGLPVLYVEPPGHTASRQIAGTPGDLTCVRPGGPDGLKEDVRRWIRQRRHRIEANAGRRQGRRISYALLHQRLYQEWGLLDPTERQQTAAQLGVTPNLIKWWLTDVDYLANAPTAHIVSLTVALTGTPDPVVGRHELALSQLEALLTARDEHHWDEPTTEALRRRGEQELATPAVRRFKLDTPEDWTRLYEATRL
jgi:hypothetical protein